MKKLVSFFKNLFGWYKKYRYIHVVNCTAGNSDGEIYYATKDIIEYTSIAQIRKIDFDPFQDLFLVNVKANDFVLGE